jgi:hypothetical protein
MADTSRGENVWGSLQILFTNHIPDLNDLSYEIV